MALTEAVRLRMEANEFGPLFEEHRANWTLMAEQARELMAGQMDHAPAVDDVRKALLPLVEINPVLREFLQREKLTQKYWIGDFTDYILHRIYSPALNI